MNKDPPRPRSTYIYIPRTGRSAPKLLPVLFLHSGSERIVSGMDRYILQRTCRDKKKRYVVAVFENALTGSYTWQVTDDKAKARVYPYRDADFTASCSERPMQILPA